MRARTGGERVDIGLADHIARHSPALPTRMQILNDLVQRPDQQVRSLQKFIRGELWPTAGQFLGGTTTVLGYDNALHQNVQLQPCVSIIPAAPWHQPQPLFDRRHAPRGKVGGDRAALSERQSRQTDNIRLPRGERQQTPAVAAYQDGRVRFLDGEGIQGHGRSPDSGGPRSDVFPGEQSLDDGDRFAQPLDPGAARIEGDPIWSYSERMLPAPNPSRNRPSVRISTVAASRLTSAG